MVRKRRTLTCSCTDIIILYCMTHQRDHHDDLICSMHHSYRAHIMGVIYPDIYDIMSFLTYSPLYRGLPQAGHHGDAHTNKYWRHLLVLY